MTYKQMFVVFFICIGLNVSYPFAAGYHGKPQGYNIADERPSGQPADPLKTTWKDRKIWKNLALFLGGARNVAKNSMAQMERLREWAIATNRYLSAVEQVAGDVSSVYNGVRSIGINSGLLELGEDGKYHPRKTLWIKGADNKKHFFNKGWNPLSFEGSTNIIEATEVNVFENADRLFYSSIPRLTEKRNNVTAWRKAFLAGFANPTGDENWKARAAELDGAIALQQKEEMSARMSRYLGAWTGCDEELYNMRKNDPAAKLVLANRMSSTRVMAMSSVRSAMLDEQTATLTNNFTAGMGNEGEQKVIDQINIKKANSKNMLFMQMQEQSILKDEVEITAQLLLTQIATLDAQSIAQGAYIGSLEKFSVQLRKNQVELARKKAAE